MPQLNTDDWNIAAENKKGSPVEGPVIDGNYLDLTHRKDIDEDTVNLTAEPEFEQDNARDREPSSLDALVAKIPHGPLRALDPKKLNAKWQLFEQLNSTIPLNEYGLPSFIYRADMLDHFQIQAALLKNRAQHNTALSASSQDQLLLLRDSPQTRVAPELPAGVEDAIEIPEAQGMLESAMMHLSYHEGFPATESGTPLWRRLEFEPEAAADAFEAYLTLEGARKFSDLIAYPPDEVRAWFHMYYWDVRARAFELYRVAHTQRTKLKRMLDVEDDHFKKAAAMLAKVGKAMDSIDAEALEELGPTKVVDLFEKLVKIQRISVGLNVNGGSVEEGAQNKAPSTNVIVQQVVQNTPQPTQQKDEDIDILEDAPDAIEMAQELIIRMGKTQDA